MKEAMLNGKGRVSPYKKGNCGCVHKMIKLDRPQYKGNVVNRIYSKKR